MFSKETKCLLLVIIIFIAACIETDIYLPAFTDMMFYFKISEEQVQSLLTWNFVGICISGPFYGPISDAIGRKKPLLAALGCFLLGSIMTYFSENFYGMLIGRVLQGLGSGGCFTLGIAVIFDSFQEKKAVEAVNRLNTIIPFIMAGAPVLGGFLNNEFGFRSNFLAIAIAVLLSFLICLFFYEETLAPEKIVPLRMKKVLSDFKTALTSVPFWQTTMIISLIFASYLSFLASISILFILELGVEKTILPYFQVAILGGWLSANILCGKAMNAWGLPAIKKSGVVLFICGGVGLVLAALFTPQNPYLITFPMVVYAFGVNWAQTVYFPECMEIFPDIKGVTASLITSVRLLVTAAVVAFSSMLYNGTIYPIAAVIFAVIVSIMVIIICYERKYAPKTIPVRDPHVVELI